MLGTDCRSGLNSNFFARQNSNIINLTSALFITSGSGPCQARVAKGFGFTTQLRVAICGQPVSVSSEGAMISPDLSPFHSRLHIELVRAKSATV
jgi:hypothetical protein